MEISEALSFGALVGAIAPFITAVLVQVNLRAVYKRYAAIGVAVGLVALGMISVAWPESWDQVAAMVSSSVAVMQTVFTVMKPVFDKLEQGVNPGQVRRIDE